MKVKTKEEAIKAFEESYEYNDNEGWMDDVDGSKKVPAVHEIYESLPDELKKDEDVALKAIFYSEHATQLIPEDLKHDDDFMEKAFNVAKYSVDATEYGALDIEFRENKDIFMRAFSNAEFIEEQDAEECGLAADVFSKADASIRSDVDIIKKVITDHPEAMASVPDTVKEDADLVVDTLEANVNAYNYLPVDMKINPDITAYVAEHMEDFELKFDMDIQSIKAVTAALMSEMENNEEFEPYSAMNDEEYYILGESDETATVAIFNTAPDVWVAFTDNTMELLTDKEVSNIISFSDNSLELDAVKQAGYSTDLGNTMISYIGETGRDIVYNPIDDCLLGNPDMTTAEKLNVFAYGIKEVCPSDINCSNFLSSVFKQAHMEKFGPDNDNSTISNKKFYEVLQKRIDAELKYGELSEQDRDTLIKFKDAAQKNIDAIDIAVSLHNECLGNKSFKATMKDLNNDREIALLVLHRNPWRIEVFPDELKNDKAFIKEAAVLNPKILLESQIASGDKDIVTAAVRVNKDALRFADPEIQRSLFMDAIRLNQDEVNKNPQDEELIKSLATDCVNRLSNQALADMSFVRCMFNYDLISDNQGFKDDLKYKVEVALENDETLTDNERQQMSEVKDYIEAIENELHRSSNDGESISDNEEESLSVDETDIDEDIL